MFFKASRMILKAQPAGEPAHETASWRQNCRRRDGRLQKEPQIYIITRVSGQKARETSTDADPNTVRRAEGRVVFLDTLLDPNQSFTLGDG